MAYAGDEWRGRVGTGWAAEWARTDRSFSGLTPALIGALLDSLPVVSGRMMRVLDVGCGAGETSLAIAAARDDVDVTGLDLSDALVSVAHMRGDGVANCSFVAGDAGQWCAAIPFDAAVSRHGVMFFDDPVAAFAHLRAQLRPGAPFVFSCFRDRALNPWVGTVTALLDAPAPADPHAPGPFAFADALRVENILAAAGWRNASAQAVDFRYVAGSGPDPVADATGFFARIGPAAPLIARLAPEARTEFDSRLAVVLGAHLDAGAIRFDAAAWLWTAYA